MAAGLSFGERMERVALGITTGAVLQIAAAVYFGQVWEEQWLQLDRGQRVEWQLRQASGLAGTALDPIISGYTKRDYLAKIGEHLTLTSDISELVDEPKIREAGQISRDVQPNYGTGSDTPITDYWRIQQARAKVDEGLELMRINRQQTGFLGLYLHFFGVGLVTASMGGLLYALGRQARSR